MTDSHRIVSPRSSDGAVPLERETKIENLLLAGLDQYFAGEYDRAIGFWTRVLFLDRGHPRARAYIERARSAVAERHRETEELLHRGVAAFECGDADGARRLLSSAVERGGPQEVALAYLERLDRLEAVTAPAEGGHEAPRPEPAARRVPRPRVPRPRRSLILPLATLALLVWGAAYVSISWDRIGPVLFLRQPWTGAPRPAPQAPAEDPLPVPRSAETALWRARTLFANGHLREALQALDAIPAADPLRPSADRTRSEIQQALLSGPAPSAAAGRPRDVPPPPDSVRPVVRDE